MRHIVSELRACGTSIKQQDVAYTILIGLRKEYSSLVIMLTNMSTPESLLVLEKTIEAIYIEEMRLKLFETTKVKSDFTNPNVNNPLALKHDTQLRGSQDAYVAKSGTLSLNRQHPY